MNDPYQVLGVPETATDAEVKKAYLNLARKYHPDNYHDNPLADLAQERMKEINAAYDEITKQRNGRSNSRQGNAAYGYGGTQTWSNQSSSGSSALQQVRMAINGGDLSRAEALLAACTDHNAEWNFLKGAICYRRGWLDEAKRYYQTACQMEPGSAEYRQALDFMENGGQTAYSPGGSFGTDLCGGSSFCTRLCCTWMLCNGFGYGGMRFCCI